MWSHFLPFLPFIASTSPFDSDSQTLSLTVEQAHESTWNCHLCVCVFWDWPPGTRWPQPMRRLISGEDWFPLSLQLLIACSFSCRGGFPWDFPVHIGMSAGVEIVHISFRLAVEIAWMKHPCCVHKTQSPSKLPGSSIHVWIRFLFVCCFGLIRFGWFGVETELTHIVLDTLELTLQTKSAWTHRDLPASTSVYWI